MKRRTKLFRLFCFVILGIVCGGVLAGGVSSSDAGALEYKRYQRIDFTFEPTLKLILSSNDLVIPNLNVNSSSDSNIISIETGTNVATGMQLTATVGRDDSAEHVGEEGYEDPYNTTSLVNGENSFAALSGPAASLDSSDFGVNKWGYAYSTDNGTTWVNGDSNNTSNGYNGLPIHSGTGVKIVDTSDKVDANLQFKIGAKASVVQAAGEYTNIINFYAVTKVATTNYTISYIDNSEQSQDMPTATGPIAITQDVEATISNSVPTRGGGYTFTGWCTASTNNNSCPGNYYQPGEKYPISNVGGNVAVNLYAMWKGPLIYDIVAGMVKKDPNDQPISQSAAELQATIVTPTEENPISSNSGVYKYKNSDKDGGFGVASDASSNYDIYYYRGILDSYGHIGSYGSDGLADAYPNYVKLGNKVGDNYTYTCWRIVRTTGSGGVKMVYNGIWSNNTCAKTQGGAQVTTSAFNNSSASVGGTNYNGLQYQNMHAIGYTYSNVAASTTTPTALSDLLGSSGNDTTTNKNSSIIKQYIENAWFSGAIGDYESVLEPSAGYCSDRTVYPNGSYALSNKLPEDTKVVPYGTSSMTVYRYGAFARNWSTSQNPSLKCPRGVVDIYSTTIGSGGNGQLKYPVALLTADEASFAGSGNSTAANGSSYHANSYLRSGSDFWLLSPSSRYSSGRAGGFILRSNGALNDNGVNNGRGVRPAISLSHGTNISSGSGTATDPWVIDAPSN